MTMDCFTLFYHEPWEIRMGSQEIRTGKACCGHLRKLPGPCGLLLSQCTTYTKELAGDEHPYLSSAKVNMNRCSWALKLWILALKQLRCRHVSFFNSWQVISAGVLWRGPRQELHPHPFSQISLAFHITQFSSEKTIVELYPNCKEYFYWYLRFF